MVRSNGIALESIMGMECMKTSKVIAGFKGITNTVSRVNIMADPDILSWVDEGELLLTTAYSFKQDGVETQKNFIKQCSDKGLAGIAIKIYPYLKSLPQEIIDLADQLHFPIIELDYSVPFTDIMTPVFKEIFNKQASLLERLERIHDELMEVILKGEGIEEIGDVIHKNVKNPIYIKMDFLNYSITKPQMIEEGIKKALLNNIASFYKKSGNNINQKQFDKHQQYINGKYIHRMVMPIIVKDRVYGHIFTWAIDTPLGGFDLSVLEIASTTIALEILKQLSIKEVENRYRSEFLEDLISLDEGRREKAIDRGHYFKLNNDRQYVMAVIDIDDSYSSLKQMDVDFNAVEQNIINTVYNIQEIMDKLSLEGFIATKTNGIYILLSFDQEIFSVYNTLKVFGDQLQHTMEKKLRNADFKIGLGRSYRGLMQVRNSYTDATNAIKTTDMLKNNKIAFFEDLGVYKILCQDGLKEELENFYQVTLQKLDQYDSKKSTDLIKTLEVYFECNGNFKKMSKMMFTHYNTILYRLQRIQEVTGLYLENPHHRLNLEIALKIKKLMQLS
ncbi:MAG: PucR family transcriptional regulator ligand-binding domain-containing protein [Clostridiaceae bacterium]|nr:PucR family transcriptional regulator ligand-binding domain-containing protein [Clostridiaceae bacterium]